MLQHTLSNVVANELSHIITDLSYGRWRNLFGIGKKCVL